ncbi:MAG: hypothetical protein ACH346_05680 [Chthoniobacterales bacterium]
MTTLLMNPTKHNKKLVPPQEVAWGNFLEETDENEEPPAWHAIVLEERAEEWKNREKLARPWAEVKKELKAEFCRAELRGN